MSESADPQGPQGRAAEILRAVVAEYIESAAPVGSAHVAARSGLAVSSATVRNEMGQLERDGYLVQPHTSAGRIPTDKGYRFFVDSLAPGTLDAKKAIEVKQFFSDAHGHLEQVLAETSRLLANLTDYAAVVVGPAQEHFALRSVNLVSLSSHTIVAVMVFANGAIQKATFEIDQSTDVNTISEASEWLNRHLVGSELGKLNQVPTTQNPPIDLLVNSALEAIKRLPASGDDHAFVGGAARMAAAFDAVDTVRRVLEILEQQYVVASLLRDLLNRGVSVAIGAEHGVISLSDCSVVVAPYEIQGELAGTVGILGPTRMRYEDALAAVAMVSNRLGRTLSSGESN